MKDEIASGIVVVRVVMNDPSSSDRPTVQFWAAAVPREQAVAAVMEKLPPHWTAELTDEQLMQDHVRRLNMKLGGVSELSLAK